MKRPLPSAEEARAILAAKRTRPARKPPPPVGRRLTKFVKSLDERFGQGANGLAARWRDICGEPVSRISEPVRLVTPKRGGAAILEIRVAGPAAALVQHQSPTILAKVNLYLGEGAVDRLRIVQGPVAIKPQAGGRIETGRRARAPLDAAQEAALIGETPDGPLKDALVRLGREVLRAPSR
jgi:hypothetical protein